ncbi:MAG: C40 family peptidase [Saprospiraceae bacterium]|nr:C40 family peptidase [Saprospiraceae bacterium]
MKTTNFNRWILYAWIAILLSGIVLSCAPERPSLQAYRLKSKDSKLTENFRNEIVEFARKQMGTKYKKAGKGNEGFDCSGFVGFVFHEFRIQMGSCAHEQAEPGAEILTKEAKCGDLIFFGTSKRISHVGIITQNKKNELWVIHSTSSRGVIEENILKSDYWVRKIIKIVDLNSYLKSGDISQL